MFGAIFIGTVSHRDVAENFVKKFVVKEIEKRFHDDFPYFVKIKNSIAPKRFLEKTKIKFRKQLHKVNTLLISDLPERISEQIATMCTCEGFENSEIMQRQFEENRKALQKGITESLSEKKFKMEIGLKNLDSLIRGYYYEITSNLIRDVRIFSGSNTILFFLMLMMITLSNKYGQALLVPCSLLLMGTLIGTGIYLLGQDWLNVILFNDYMGYGYLGYVGVITALLGDILFNSGKVCRYIFNLIIHAIGTIAAACG